MEYSSLNLRHFWSSEIFHNRCLYWIYNLRIGINPLSEVLLVYRSSCYPHSTRRGLCQPFLEQWKLSSNVTGHTSSSLGSEAVYTALYLHVSVNGMISNLTSSACAKLKRSLPMDPSYNENEYRWLRCQPQCLQGRSATRTEQCEKLKNGLEAGPI